MKRKLAFEECQEGKTSEESQYAEIPDKDRNKYINKNNNIEGVSENDLEKETNLIENIENPLLRKD
jgi:hypothetical protein